MCKIVTGFKAVGCAKLDRCRGAIIFGHGFLDPGDTLSDRLAVFWRADNPDAPVSQAQQMIGHDPATFHMINRNDIAREIWQGTVNCNNWNVSVNDAGKVLGLPKSTGGDDAINVLRKQSRYVFRFVFLVFRGVADQAVITFFEQTLL